MIREDYILRMIEQIGELVGRVLNQSIPKEDLDSELETIARQCIGLPASLLLSLPVDHAYSLISDSDRMVVEKCYLMGEMFRAKGIESGLEAVRMEHFEKARCFFNKCSGLVDLKLQHEVDERLAELNAELRRRSR